MGKKYLEAFKKHKSITYSEVLPCCLAVSFFHFKGTPAPSVHCSDTEGQDAGHNLDLFLKDAQDFASHGIYEN